MKQKEIRRLLEEASQLHCTWQRRNQIQCQLGEASAAVCGDGAESRVAGLQLILDKLYVDTLKSYPGYLPKLFPVFAMICGERDNRMLVTDVNWYLCDKQVYDSWNTLNRNQEEVYGVLEEVKECLTLLKAYEPLGTPEEIKNALDASFQMLAVIRKIGIAVKESGVTAGLDA